MRLTTCDNDSEVSTKCPSIVAVSTGRNLPSQIQNAQNVRSSFWVPNHAADMDHTDRGHLPASTALLAGPIRRTKTKTARNCRTLPFADLHSLGARTIDSEALNRQERQAAGHASHVNYDATFLPPTCGPFHDLQRPCAHQPVIHVYRPDN